MSLKRKKLTAKAKEKTPLQKRKYCKIPLILRPYISPQIYNPINIQNISPPLPPPFPVYTPPSEYMSVKFVKSTKHKFTKNVTLPQVFS